MYMSLIFARMDKMVMFFFSFVSNESDIDKTKMCLSLLKKKLIIV